MEEDELPDGLWGDNDRFYFQCLSCGAVTEYEGDDPKDFVYDYTAVCGGSPRCIP